MHAQALPTAPLDSREKRAPHWWVVSEPTYLARLVAHESGTDAVQCMVNTPTPTSILLQ